MSQLAITESAATTILARFRSSEIANATASLLDRTAALPVSQAIGDALSRSASDSEMRDLAVEEYGEVLDTLEFRLDIGVYASSECRPQDLVDIGGISFALPMQMRECLAGYILDYVDGRFMLKKGERVFLRLRDLDGGEDRAA